MRRNELLLTLMFWLGIAVSQPMIAMAAPSQSLLVTDSIVAVRDDSPDAQRMLDRFTWQPQQFQVDVQDPSDDEIIQVTFPSPRPRGDAIADRVPLAWYAVRDELGQIAEAPAVLVVHTLHPRMVFAQAMARGLRERGVHAFVISLPGYGLRRTDGSASGLVTLEHGGQAVADVRRARDVVMAIPQVQGEQVALTGASLGGFVASLAGAVDTAFDPVLLLLSGADLQRVIGQGQRDAAAVRDRLARAGYVGPRLRALLQTLEPATVAHRLNPQRTWMITARFDRVVPPACSETLAAAIGLDASHHVQLQADHYTAVLYLPSVVHRLVELVHDGEQAQAALP